MADVTDDKKKPLTDEKFLFAIIKQLDGTVRDLHPDILERC